MTPNYFSTMGLRLVAGHLLQPGDRGEAAHAVVVNETFAKRFWPDGNAVGSVMPGRARVRAITPWSEPAFVMGNRLED